MHLTDEERRCGEAAAALVKKHGGYLSFDQYDEIAGKELVIWTPLSWCYGWGNLVTHRRNNEKLSAFAACGMGLLKQESDGYRVVQ